MDMYTAVKNRILQLLGEKRMSIHRLAMESAVAPSSIKNILYGKSKNPGIVTLKMQLPMPLLLTTFRSSRLKARRHRLTMLSNMICLRE